MPDEPTFGEYVTRSVQPIDEIGYPLTLPWLFSTVAELIFLIRYQTLASEDEEPSTADILYYRQLHELDYIAISVQFTVFVKWLIDKQIDIYELQTNGTEYIVGFWNEFISTEWTKRGERDCLTNQQEPASSAARCVLSPTSRRTARWKVGEIFAASIA